MKLGKLLCCLLIVILLSPACTSVPLTEILPIVTATKIHSTSTPSLIPTLSVTDTAVPISTLSVSSPPDGLYMAYIVGGNLYFQNGSSAPLQLTDSGKDWSPIFSEDGKKIVFFRGEHREEIYSINVDGSQEQALVTSKLLMKLDNSYSESTRVHDPVFVPGTHLLLFSTLESQPNMPRWNGDLFTVDTDTAEIKRLLPRNQIGQFYVSPDGKYVAINAIGQIDVIDIDGKPVRQSLLTYTPSEPVSLSPGISWMSDSRELVVILPVPTNFEVGDIPDYTVWHYPLEGGTGVQVSLEPLPRDYYLAKVSPDGNWVIYNNYDQNASYIGDLRDGHARIYGPQILYTFYYDWSWSPDSKHFIYRETSGDILYLGSITAPPTLIGQGEFLGWMDSNRYLYYADKNIILGNIDGLKEIIFADHESFKNRTTIFTFIFPKTSNN